MNIELTQDEVKAAVSLYVENVIGINLVGKTLGIVFSATRYEGTIAKLTITPNTGAAPVAAPVAASTTLPGYGDGTIDTGVEPEPIADPAEPEVAAAAQAEQTLGDPVQEAATLVAVPDEPVGGEADTVPAADETTAAPVAETKPADTKPKGATLFGKPAATV